MDANAKYSNPTFTKKTRVSFYFSTHCVTVWNFVCFTILIEPAWERSKRFGEYNDSTWQAYDEWETPTVYDGLQTPGKQEKKLVITIIVLETHSSDGREQKATPTLEYWICVSWLPLLPFHHYKIGNPKATIVVSPKPTHIASLAWSFYESWIIL